MNLAHLYYFVKLAELQHCTNAAQELHITQPSLSGAIACMEKELGITLFQKRGRNIFLTKYGKEFYFHVKTALNELDKGLSIAKEHAENLGGIIDIACISTIQGDYLPSVIHNFNTSKGGHIKFSIYQRQTNAIIEGIKAEHYDVGFCSLIDDRDLHFVPILNQELVAAVHRNHSLASARALTFAELQNYRLISYHRDQPIGRKVNALLNGHGLQADLCYSDEVTLGGMAITEHSVAITLKTPSLRQFSNLAIIPLVEVPDDFRIVYMVFNKHTYKTRAVECLIDYVSALNSCNPIGANPPIYDPVAASPVQWSQTSHTE